MSEPNRISKDPSPLIPRDDGDKNTEMPKQFPPDEDKPAVVERSTRVGAAVINDSIEQFTRKPGD